MKKIMKILISLTIFFNTIFALGLGFNNQNFLPIQKAFHVDATIQKNNIEISIDLAKDIHIYDEELKFNIIKPKKIDLTNFAIKPQPLKDESGIKIYNKSLKIQIPISKIKDQLQEKSFTLKVELMGCSDKGLCYPPVIKTFDLTLPQNPKKEKNNDINSSQKQIITKTLTTNSKTTDINNTQKSSKNSSPNISTNIDNENKSEESKIVEALKNKSLLSILAMFFGFGLLLSLTPCIFPMIPILSSIIVSSSKNKKITMGRGIFLSIVYILSMATAYTIAGVIAGLFGAKFNIQAAMQNPYILIAFASIFIILAFSMFGYYEIQLPTSLQTKLSTKSNQAADKGGVLGVAIMGFLSALIVGPCVAPALAGALVYIGQTGDALLGGAALFVMSLGMGAPLLIVGAGAGKFMPKPGGWMSKVSEIFGVVMLALAIWMLDRILEPSVTMFLWAFLLIGSGIFFGALEPFNTTGAKRIFKVISFIILLFGIFELIGAITGATNPLKPFEKFTSATTYTPENKITFKTIKKQNELDQIINTSTKPILIDFSAKWCVSCKEMEENTFKDPQVKKLLKNFTLVRIDITQNTDFDKKMLEKFEIVGPPAIIFFKNKKLLKDKKIIGYKPPEFFAKILESILKKD